MSKFTRKDFILQFNKLQVLILIVKELKDFHKVLYGSHRLEMVNVWNFSLSAKRKQAFPR